MQDSVVRLLSCKQLFESQNLNDSRCDENLIGSVVDFYHDFIPGIELTLQVWQDFLRLRLPVNVMKS